jgi:hypothetical protein
MYKIFTLVFFTLVALNSSAHSFHVGLATADYDEEKEMLFCTLQLEYNDLTHWLEDLKLTFNLEELAKNQRESPSWQTFKQFIAKHYAAKTNHSAIDFELFGLELELDGRLFVYVYAENVKPFESITWTFSMLMGHSMEQQNKLEFKYIRSDNKETYFAYFFETEQTQIILLKKD